MNFKLKYKEFTLAESTTETINKPEKVFDCLKDDFNPLAEELYLLILNTKNNVIEKHLVSKGGLNMVMMKPADIFKLILLTSGENFILAHNHPSGDVTPSEEDIQFSRRITKLSKELGLIYLDNIIYTNNNIYSFRKNSLI